MSVSGVMSVSLYQTPAFNCCVACSPQIIQRYHEDKYGFVRAV